MDDLRDRLRKAYDRKAPQREMEAAQGWKLEERNAFFQLLRFHKTRSLLEIGSGPGSDASWFLAQGLDVVCVDLSPESVRLCRTKGLTAHVMDVTRLEFEDRAFDAVFTRNCLLHLPKTEIHHALREIRRVLRPGGLVYVGLYGGRDHEGVWDEDTYEPKRFFSFYHDDNLLREVGRLFDVISFRPIETGSDAGGLHFQSFVLQRPMEIQVSPQDGSQPSAIQ